MRSILIYRTKPVEAIGKMAFAGFERLPFTPSIPLQLAFQSSARYVVIATLNLEPSSYIAAVEYRQHTQLSYVWPKAERSSAPDAAD